MTETSTPKTRNFALYTFVVVLLLGITLSTAAILYYLDSRPTSQITVQGKATKTIKYDKVTLNFYIQKRGTAVPELNTDADNDTTKTTDYLKTLGIKTENIQTSKNSYEDFIPTFAPTTSEQNYKVSVVEVRVTVKIPDLQNNLDLPNKITAEVVNYGVKRFDSNSYEVSNETAICEELKDQAIKDARSKAEKRISSLSNGKIVKTNLQDFNSCDNLFPRYYSLDNLKSSAPAAPIANPTPEVFTGQKEITQELTLVADYR
jgi:uncharacterized protein YggE